MDAKMGNGDGNGDGNEIETEMQGLRQVNGVGTALSFFSHPRRTPQKARIRSNAPRFSQPPPQQRACSPRAYQLLRSTYIIIRIYEGAQMPALSLLH